jgi:predicted nucleic acid-binding protein
LPGQALDTNILAYAAGLRRAAVDEVKIGHAEDLISLLWGGELVIPAQVLAELHNVLRRKGSRRSSRQATEVVAEYAMAGRIIPTDHAVLEMAFALATAHSLQTYDAIILAAAAMAGCDILFSEDMQDGFEWQGVRIVNPFA